MHRCVLLGILTLSLAAVGRAQTPAEFVGKMEPELTPGRIVSSVSLTPATVEAQKKLGTLVSAGDRVFSGDVAIGDGRQTLFVIASGADSRAIIADMNGNGTYEPGEKVRFGPTSEAGYGLEATVRLPTPQGTFKAFPVRVGLKATSLNPTAERWAANASYQAFANGVVAVDGRPTKVRLMVYARILKADPMNEFQYLDGNGDGVFDEDITSWEMGSARGGAVVFHVGDGDRYVSITSVDAAAGTVTLSARAASDYERIELRLGAALPDFAFKTIDGTPKRLSDFRGKYLMLDFWGTWCGPCIAEIPYIKKAYETYNAKGFEVLGMDSELPDVTAEDLAKGLEKAKAFVVEKGITWTQARTESIKALVTKRFQIAEWPTMILLDPDGKIISVDRTSRGEPGLRGDALGKTLAEIFKGK